MRRIEDLAGLKGRTALITGGAGHIGMAIAEALGEAGAEIAIADRDEARLAEAAERLSQHLGRSVSSHAVDLLDEDAVRQLPDAAARPTGRLDVLVNCAAFVGTSALEGWAEPFERQGTKAWRMAMEVNVTSAFELIQSALPLLRANDCGSVINIASIYGVVGPDWSLYEGTQMANPAAYGASKGALIQLTHYLATTLAPQVRVNTITPGGVARGQPQAFVDRYVTRTPMKRMAIEEDFKGAALFLASDLSAYVTGQNIVVDGGWTTL